MSEVNKTADEVMEETVEEAAETVEEAAETVEETAEAVETEEVSETAEDTDQDGEDAPKKKIFGKKKDKKDEKIEELTDRLQRTMAEFDNYRKRTEKEKASMYIIGAKDIVEKMLPVVDNFERALATITEEQKEDAFVTGMDKIYKHLLKTLEDMGVKAIEAVGKEFDPNFHNAVMHVDDETVGENVVVEEFQKGYLYKDFVIRYSMVKVAN